MVKFESMLFKVLKFVAVIFLFFFIPSIPFIVHDLFNHDINSLSNSDVIYFSLISNIVLLLVLFVIYRKDLIKEFKIFKNNLGECMSCGFKWWLIGLGGMMVSNILIQSLLNQDQAANEQAVQEMITVLPWIMLISAGFLVPIIEEICFRKTFYDLIKNKWVFIFSSGLLFGVLHVVLIMSDPIELLFIIPYGVLGVVFAIMYHKTKNVYTPIVMHMIHNVILVSLAIFLL